MSEHTKHGSPFIPLNAAHPGVKMFLLLPVPLVGTQKCLSLAEPGLLPAYMNNMKVAS